MEVYTEEGKVIFQRKPNTEYVPPTIFPDDSGPARMPRQQVRLRRALARMGGYFWLPCPLCGFEFAGYEIGKRSVPVEGEPGMGKTCCRWCDEEVRTFSEVFGEMPRE